jgi:hypothetical protein
MSKFSFHNQDYNKNQTSNRVFHMGVVESNTDISDCGRIKVRVKGIDDHIKHTNDLANSFPLVQKFIHIVPKIGETVWIFTPDADNPFKDRLYVGPIISQPQFLNKDPHVVTSTAGLDGGFVGPQTAPSTIPENKGSYPKNNEIAIQGRNNSDVTLKDTEVVIRAGKFLANDKIEGIPKFNKKNPSYIQVKHNVMVNDKTSGVINVVSDKINLLTHENGNPKFNLTNQDDLIDKEEMLKIIADAHPMVFGDLLIEYLELFKKAVITHVHPYNGMPPQDIAGQVHIKKLLEYDVSKIISKNIKLN